jgi:uncharacterized protein
MPARKTAKFNVGFILLAAAIGILVGVWGTLEFVSIPALEAANENVAAELPVFESLSPHYAGIHIVGVSAETSKGIVGNANIELVPGSGRMLVSTDPFIEPDTQQSAAIAKIAAENYTGVSFDKSDIIASFDLPMGDTPGQVIGGPSAGAALAVAISAMAMNKTVKSDVAITGTIMPNGSIGAISGTVEKAVAAAEAGMRTFVVPVGQSNITHYEKTVEHESLNGFAITRISYISRTLSLDDYTAQWNMTSVEAKDIGEAMRYAIA